MKKFIAIVLVLTFVSGCNPPQNSGNGQASLTPTPTIADAAEVTPEVTRPEAKGNIPNWRDYADTYQEYLKDKAGFTNSTIDTTDRNLNLKIKPITSDPTFASEKCFLRAYSLVLNIPKGSQCGLNTEFDYTWESHNMNLPVENWGFVDLGARITGDFPKNNYLQIEIYQSKEPRDMTTPLQASDAMGLEFLTVQNRKIIQYVGFSGSYVRYIEVQLDQNTTLILSFIVQREEGISYFEFPSNFEEVINYLVSTLEYN